MNFNRITVGSKIGALTGFVSDNINQSILGVSAFHVLSGSNRAIDPFDDIVEVMNLETMRWLKFGTTVDGRYYKGDGTNSNFGLLDFAYFELYDSFMNRIKANLNELTLSQYLIAPNTNNLNNKLVYGYSVIDENPIIGRINTVYFQGSTNCFDIEISIENGYTHEGDSGMLWKDDQGLPFLMHIRGNSSNYSNKSYCTFLNRIIGARRFYEFKYRIDS